MAFRSFGSNPKFGHQVDVQQSGTAILGTDQTINFTGAGVTATQDGTNPNQVNVTIPGGGGSSATGTPGDIQYTDGAGAFQADPEFAWGTAQTKLELGLNSSVAAEIESGDALTIRSAVDKHIVLDNPTGDGQIQISRDSAAATTGLVLHNAGSAHSRMQFTGTSNATGTNIGAAGNDFVIQHGVNGGSIHLQVDGGSGLTIYKPSGAVRETVATGNITLATQGDLKFEDLSNPANHFYVGFQAPVTLAADSLYTWPGSFPGSDMVLQSDSSGTLSWVAGGGGGGTSLTVTGINGNNVPANAAAGTMYICDTDTNNGGAFTVELPTAANAGNGGEIDILAQNATATGNAVDVIVESNSSDTINGQASVPLNTTYQNLTLVSDGVDKWWIR